MMDCRYFDGCSAPLCPGDEGIAARTWFPDEDICRLADVHDWVKRQRKVSRKAASGAYFVVLRVQQIKSNTLAMLKQDCRLSRGMKGIDPNGTDKEQANDEAAWFKAHPVITAEERERNRVIGLKNKGFLDGKGCKKSLSKTGPDVGSGKKGSWIPPALD
jgi:hypothetical protein